RTPPLMGGSHPLWAPLGTREGAYSRTMLPSVNVILDVPEKIGFAAVHPRASDFRCYADCYGAGLGVDVLCSLPNSFSNPFSHLSYSPASQLSDCKVFYFLDQQSNSAPDSINFENHTCQPPLQETASEFKFGFSLKFFPHKVCNISEVLPLRIQRIFLIKVPEQSTRLTTEGTQRQAKGHLPPMLFLMCMCPVENKAEGMVTEMEPIFCSENIGLQQSGHVLQRLDVNLSAAVVYVEYKQHVGEMQ
ncbi:hypothetical protein CFP56_011252, partial [Quercus suber]